MSAGAPAASGSVLSASSVLGGVIIAVLIASVTTFALNVDFGGEEHIRQISYSRLLDGDVGPGETFISVNLVEVNLISALDPADELVELIEPRLGHRLVLFTFFLTNLGSTRESVFIDDFQLSYADETDKDPLLAVAGRR